MSIAGKVTTWFVRIVVGVVFIYSGWVKAVDPLGFSYKLTEYFEKFAEIFINNDLGFLAAPMEFFAYLSLPMAMIFVVLEIVLGVLTLTGSYMKAVTKWLLAIILFFTFLTFVSWAFDIVKSCGCFGDAIPLTAFTSFIKDCVLLILILILFLFRNKIPSILTPLGDKLGMWSSTIVFTLLTWYCYQHLPLVDFRAYAPGKRILPQMEAKPGNPLNIYKLKYNGPDSTEVAFSDYPFNYEKWTYVGTEELEGEHDVMYVKIDSGKQTTRVFHIPEFFKDKWEVVKDTTEFYVPYEEPKIQQLHAYGLQDTTDYLNQILNREGYYFLGVIRDMEEWGSFDTNNERFVPTKDAKEIFGKLNSLAKNGRGEKPKVKFDMLTRDSEYGRVQLFKHGLQCPFNFYSCDDTELKTMIRSSPGLFLLKKDSVIAKWHYNDFPNFEEVKDEYIK